MNKEITNFVNDELYPMMFDRIDTLFPEMGFKLHKGKWRSPKNLDGTTPSNPRPDKTIVTSKQPRRAMENGDGGTKDLISLYMDFNHIGTPIEAIKDICRMVGLEVPEADPESLERFKDYQKRQDEMEASLQRQKAALKSNTGLLYYLKGRGWTEEDIEKAELGYISLDEAQRINAQNGIGTEYELSIPLRSGGKLYGFKFRTQRENVGKNQRYQYLVGTKKKDNLFGLTGLRNYWKDIVVVEGELDALHAQVRGIENVVATSGGKLTTELLEAARGKGIKNVTLLLDNDKAGEAFIKESIVSAESMGMTAFVASLTDAKDVDEFLKNHSADELKSIIDNATTAHIYLLRSLVSEAIEMQGGEGGVLSEKQRIELKDKVIRLANDTKDETERDMILSEFSQCTGEAISKEALLAVADERRAEAEALTKKNETGAALKEIVELYKGGNVEAALTKMKEASTSIKVIDHRKKYGSLLAIPTESEITTRMKNKQDAIPTDYLFSKGSEKERLTIPSGAITFFCAPTSHGKSTILQNIALQIADRAKQGETVLYFSFEEDKDAVLLQFLNKSMDMELCRNYDNSTSNNLRALSHYYRTGEDRYISHDKKSEFHQKRTAFMAKYITSGRLRIFYEDFDSAEVIEAIKYICSQTKVKCVFIDYIQLLNSNEYRSKRMVRTEELKEMCKDFKNLAVGYDLPIVVAAQLNREATSPISMHSQNIAEAADLERIANRIICMWNSRFEAQKSDKNDTELKNFKENIMQLNVGGKMYMKYTKNRGGIVGLEAVLEYKGNTGVVVPNYKEKPSEQTDLPFEPESNRNYF